MKVAVYPGSFDPVTNGHIDIIKRSAAIFDKVIVGVLQNNSKTPLFTTEERISFLKESVGELENVEVDSFSGLLVDFLSLKNAKIIIKGLRSVTDFEYEFQMALLNKCLSNEAETFFMMTNSKFSYLSSSMVREVAKFGGNVEEFVPKCVNDALKIKLNG